MGQPALNKARKSKQGCVDYKEKHLMLFLSIWKQVTLTCIFPTPYNLKIAHEKIRGLPCKIYCAFLIHPGAAPPFMPPPRPARRCFEVFLNSIMLDNMNRKRFIFNDY